MLTTILLATLLLATPGLAFLQSFAGGDHCLAGTIPSVFDCVWCVVSMQPGCLTITVPREASAARSITFHADRTLTASSARYMLRAYLSNGSAAQSTMSIKNALSLTTPTTSTILRTSYVSYAKPIAPGTTTQLDIMFPYPTTVVTSNPWNISSVTIRTPNQESLFPAPPPTGK